MTFPDDPWEWRVVVTPCALIPAAFAAPADYLPRSEQDATGHDWELVRSTVRNEGGAHILIAIHRRPRVKWHGDRAS
jgi:hypothetical protein